VERGTEQVDVGAAGSEDLQRFGDAPRESRVECWLPDVHPARRRSDLRVEKLAAREVQNDVRVPGVHPPPPPVEERLGVARLAWRSRRTCEDERRALLVHRE